MRGEMTVIVASGIGDFSWVWSKICRLDCDFHIRIAQTGGPSRLLPFVELLPKVSSVGVVRMNFQQLRSKGVSACTNLAQLESLRQQGPISIEANTHLETGNRIETFLPEIPIDYHYDIRISKEHVDQALALIPGYPFLCIFTSAVGTAKAWNAWLPNEWANFLIMFRENVADIPVVHLGARWDMNMAVEVEKLAKLHGLKYVNLVGKTHIAAALHIMSLSSYFLAFPSGMAVLADVICAPATMFWPKIAPHIHMVHKFADPESTSSGRFHEQFFVPPAEYLNWLVNTYKIKDKL